MSTQKVLSGNRINLPASFCKKHDIKEGEIVILQETETSLIIKKGKVIPSE